jgi:hypothetical protein
MSPIYPEPVAPICASIVNIFSAGSAKKALGAGGVSALSDKLDQVIKDNKTLADRIKYLEEQGK